MRSLAQRLESGPPRCTVVSPTRGTGGAGGGPHLGEVEVDASTITDLTWQEICISFAQHMFDALGRHGNVAPLLIGHVPMGANAAAHRELILRVLLDSGFPPDTAARTYATLSRYILGLAMQVSRSAAVDHYDAELSAAFQQLDPSRYPATVAVAEQLPVPLAEEFMFGLQRIVAGLEMLHPSPHAEAAEVFDHGA